MTTHEPDELVECKQTRLGADDVNGGGRMTRCRHQIRVLKIVGGADNELSYL